jgi:hypothetical protein
MIDFNLLDEILLPISLLKLSKYQLSATSMYRDPVESEKR